MRYAKNNPMMQSLEGFETSVKVTNSMETKTGSMLSTYISGLVQPLNSGLRSSQRGAGHRPDS